MDNSGWIKLHRSLLKWEWYDDIPSKVLFLHLLLKANHESSKWHGQLVERGQLIVGRDELAKQTGLTIQQLRTALDKLKSTSQITSKATNKFTVISICNYDKYQDQSTSQITSKATNEQPTNNQQSTTNKNEKNLRTKEKIHGVRFAPPTPQEVEEYCKERKNGISGQYFCDFYQARGWKLSSGASLKDWRAAVRTWEQRQKSEKKSSYPILT